MPVYNKRGILLLPKVIVLNPKDGKFPRWARFYVSYILPLIVIFILVQGYIAKFF